jgi:protein gp37
MGAETGIAWCDHTWSPWGGCQNVSAACDYCYAEALDVRFGKSAMWGPHGIRQPRSDSGYSALFAMDRAAKKAGVRRSVFPSMCDPFDNHSTILQSYRDRHWDAIRRTPNLLHLLLTKRPENIEKYLPPDWGCGWDNVYLGVTAEDQSNLAHRAWRLALAPVKQRFVSYEPALGPINALHVTNRWGTMWNAITGRLIDGPAGCPDSVGAITWWICGGESGPHHRPFDPAWAQNLQHQCGKHGAAFFMKQMAGNTKAALNAIPPDLMIREFPNAG